MSSVMFGDKDCYTIDIKKQDALDAIAFILLLFDTLSGRDVDTDCILRACERADMIWCQNQRA